MFYIFSKILSLVADPIAWVVAAFVLAFVLKKRRLQRLFFITGIVLVLFFGNNLVRTYAEQWWCNNYTAPIDTSKVYDYVLLQGGFGEFNPANNRTQLGIAAERLTESIRLYHTGRVKKLFITGDGAFSDPEYPASRSVFLNYMKDMGVNEADIILDDKALNTRQSAVRTPVFLGKNYTGEQSLIITSAVHMPRALACYRKAGMNPVPYSTSVTVPYELKLTNFGISSENLFKWSMLMHEMVGMVLYKIMGYV